MAWRDFFVDHEGRRIAVRDFGGDGPAMLLLHGGGGTVAGWNGLAAQLVPEVTVVGYDAHGHGQSDTPDAPAVGLPLREIGAVARALGMERPILVGSSMGGANAVRYAAEGGPCAAVVAIDGAPFWHAGEEIRPPVDRDAYREEMRAAGWGGTVTAEELEAAVATAVRERGDADEAIVEAEQRRAHVDLGDGTFLRKPTLDYLVALRALGDEMLELDGIELFDRIEVPVLLLNAVRGWSPAGATSDEQRRRLDDVAARRPNVTSEWIDAGHLIHWEKPRLVANRIRELVSQTRGAA